MLYVGGQRRHMMRYAICLPKPATAVAMSFQHTLMFCLAKKLNLTEEGKR